MSVVYSRKRRSRAVEAAEDTVTGDNSWTCHTVSFGGQAPKLKHFSCAGLLLPAVEQSCFSQVVHLECGEINGQALLNALAFMPKIETLHVHIIEDLPSIPFFSPTNVVILPCLHRLHIESDSAWLVGLIILFSLRPSFGFQLVFEVHDSDGDISVEEANAIRGVLSPFLMNTPWDPEEDSLDIKLYGSLFAIDTRQLRLNFWSWDSMSELTSILSIPHAMFLHATKLDIDIKGPENDPAYENDIVQFLSSLTVADSMSTDMETLEYIHELSSSSPQRSKSSSTIVVTFMGTQSSRGLWGRNLSNLERFDGTLFRGYFGYSEKVCYVCGSGSPETLDFTAIEPNIARREEISVAEMLERMRVASGLQDDYSEESEDEE
ncbi:hypothetical protein D9613_009255 [Agrocybe pediades]|uniref:Uncharacterized protein n=1 Tax=Agrocybe pediades TaxID=84607 RepID=A0A8H4R4F2_9AGAR|nr:hypothetical protein D9613_009255 [Agrocybe pediades]